VTSLCLLLTREMPVSQVGKLVDESDTRLWRMIFKHGGWGLREAILATCVGVGVDELNHS